MCLKIVSVFRLIFGPVSNIGRHPSCRQKNKKRARNEWQAFIYVRSDEVIGKYSCSSLMTEGCVLQLNGLKVTCMTAYSSAQRHQCIIWARGTIMNRTSVSSFLSGDGLLLGGNESMIHRHCSNSSPCVITAKVNSSLVEKTLNQQIVCVFTSSKGTFSDLRKGRNLRSNSF